MSQAIADGRLDAAASAAYQKLGRTPLPVSVAFLRECTARVRPLFPSHGIDLPSSLSGFQAVAFDGKAIKHVARRLKPLRTIRGRMPGAELLDFGELSRAATWG